LSGPQKYTLRSGDGTYDELQIPWSPAVLDNIAALSVPGHDPAIEGGLGEFIRQFLRPTGWSSQEREITRALQEGRRVQVLVRSAASEIYILPWELLRLRGTGQCLGSIPGVIIRYQWPGARPTPARSPERLGQGRVVIGWSAQGGSVPAAQHIAAIEEACQASGRTLNRERDVLAHLSLSRLAEALAAGERTGEPIEWLHLLCHGAAQGSAFGLVLDSDEGERVIVEPSRLQQVVARYAHTLRLVVFSACDSGNNGRLGAVVGSVAQMLHRAGIEAVLASRYPLSVAGSICMTSVFYRALMSEPTALDAAFLAAREKLALDAETLDWASLQLLGHVDADAGPAATTAAATQERPQEATFYSKPDHAGESCSLGLGSYDMDELEQYMGNDRISSVRVPAGLRVSLFEDNGFAGMCEVLDADAPEIFLAENVSSLRVEPHGVTTFEQMKFGGASQFLLPGQRLRVERSIGSARVPPGLRLSIMTPAAGGSASEPTEVVTSVPDLSLPPGPYELSVERFCVRLFDTKNFTGRSQALGIGRYGMDSLVIGNDAVRSIRIPGGLVVTVYADDGFTGESLVLREDTAEIPLDISSIIIASQRQPSRPAS
jgi:hypothetical protein